MVGFVSLIGYSIQLELLYSWYRYTRMAVHTAGGFALFAIGLWLEWYRFTIQAGAFDEQEDQRVNLIGGALIIVVTITAGISGFSLLAGHTERIALHALQAELGGHIRAIDTVLAERRKDVQRLARLPQLHAGLRDAARGNHEPVQHWSESLVVDDVAAITVHSPDGALLARAGSPWRSPSVDFAIERETRLLWDDGARLRSYVAIEDAAGTKLGTLQVEMELPIIAQLIASTATVSETADLRICGGADAATMQCLPTRLSRQSARKAPRVVRDAELPSSLALRGESGAQVFVNFRAVNSVGAYGKTPQADLGLVMQQASEETYAAIRTPLRYLMMCLAALVIGAIALLRWQIAPLVRKMMAAKVDAAANATRIASIMNSVPDGIIMIDRRGHIAEVNPAISALFGYSKEELLGQSITVLMPQATRSAHDAGFDRSGVRRLIGRGGVEVPALRKDGTEFLMQLSLSELAVDSQHFVVGVMRDVTERKAAERVKDEFISVVSHELRTPLTSIAGSLGLLAGGAAGELPPKANQLVQIANRNSDRLGRLINDILDLEKADGGKPHMRIESHDVRAIVERVIETNQPYAQRLGVRLVLDATGHDACVAVDRDRFAQVLTNVISNAAKFSPQDECVSVRIVAAETGVIRIEVTDRGPGVPEAFRARIFQKFAQADSSDTRAKGGTGLGLSIAKSLIESMGGNIGYHCSAQGTTFYVTVPLAAPPQRLAVGG